MHQPRLSECLGLSITDAGFLYLFFKDVLLLSQVQRTARVVKTVTAQPVHCYTSTNQMGLMKSVDNAPRAGDVQSLDRSRQVRAAQRV